MTVMITEVWDALKSVGVEDDKARRAAEAVADYRAGFNERLEAGFAEAAERDAALRQELRESVAALRQEMQGANAALRQEMRDADGALSADVKLLKWMAGATFAGVIAILLRLFV